MGLYQQLVQHIYLPHLARVDKDIGYKLTFLNIPDRYISGIMSCEMTKTWRKAGLNVVRGKNHFTMGKVINGLSSRFDPKAPEYQSWLGGYTVKLKTDQSWSAKDYFQFSIADQNSWLDWYGDPNPSTTIEGFEPVEVGEVRVRNYTGTLYEFGCLTHSDLGLSHPTLKLRFAAASMAVLYNLANPKLGLTSNNFIPDPVANPYEPIELRGLFAIFEITPQVKVILYANGVARSLSFKIDTFEILKDDLLKAINACKIVTT